MRFGGKPTEHDSAQIKQKKLDEQTALFLDATVKSKFQPKRIENKLTNGSWLDTSAVLVLKPLRHQVPDSIRNPLSFSWTLEDIRTLRQRGP